MRKNMGGEGFTLIELLVVLVIVACLAIAMVQVVSSCRGEVESADLQCRGGIQTGPLRSGQARPGSSGSTLSRAGETDDDGVEAGADGYRICLDLDSDNNCDTADSIIAETNLSAPVVYYDQNISSTGRPQTYCNRRALAGGARRDLLFRQSFCHASRWIRQ